MVEILEFVPSEVTPAPAAPAPQTATVQEPAAPAPTEEEQRAMSEGWRPLGDWKGDARKWIPAADYLRDLPFKKHISQQTRKIKELEGTLNEFRGHYSKVEERAIQKAWEKMNEQRKAAIDMGDRESVDRLEEQMTELHQEVTKIPQPAEPAPEEPPPMAKEWASRNAWFFEDPIAGGYARLVNEDFLRLHPEADYEQQLANTEREVAKRFPEKFSNSRRNEPPAVESGGTFVGGGKNKYSYNDLNDQQKKICDSFVKNGMVQDRQSYVNDLVDIGAIGGKG